MGLAAYLNERLTPDEGKAFLAGGLVGPSAGFVLELTSLLTYAGPWLIALLQLWANAIPTRKTCKKYTKLMEASLAPTFEEALQACRLNASCFCQYNCSQVYATIRTLVRQVAQRLRKLYDDLVYY